MQNQGEEVFLERVVDTRQPVRLLPAAGELQIVAGADVHPVTSVLLGEITGIVCRRHQIGDIACAGRYGHETDADADLEACTLPQEAEIADGLSHTVRQALRLLDAAVLDDDAELVASEAGERVTLTNLATQQRAYFFQKVIAGS